MAYNRLQINELIKRIDEPRRFMQVIAGPRQVGKTTLVQQALEQTRLPYLFASADASAMAGSAWIAQQWATARLQWRQSGHQEFLLVIDEIQKIANWSEAVKAEWDADSRLKTPIKVVLLGSSRLLIQQGLTESLAGRFELLYLGHWSLAEMEAAFGFTPEQYVWFGGYPGAAALADDEHRWKRYVTDALIESSISRDILLLTRVDKPALMRRLFELGCLHTGQILAFTKMLGQLTDAGNTTTLAHYLDLLDTAGLLAGLEKYGGQRLRQRASSPKFQVHNNALVSAQRPETLAEIRADLPQWGRLVESAIGAHLLNAARQEVFQLGYWREGNAEVDFVLHHRGRVLAIEVKSGAPRALAGMEQFRRRFAPDRMLLVGQGGMAWEEFLRVPGDQLF